MNFMNSVFCYKKSCPIDICQLHANHSSFLERASSLTDGMYVRAISSKSLYGLLTYYFLGEVGVRKEMLLPHDVITTSVPGSCHGKPIENGQAYICTVCLSILCQRYDKCPIHTLHWCVCCCLISPFLSLTIHSCLLNPSVCLSLSFHPS